MALTKATPIGLRARISLEGLSGSGKTTTALKLAQGLVAGTDKRIALICTERGRARLESKWCDFDIDEMETGKQTPEDFVTAIRGTYGHGVVAIDSMSAEWNELLALKDSMSDKERFTGWAKLNPRHDRVMAAILDHPSHVIGCFRSKMKHEVGDDKKVRKIGVEPIARPGNEYDWDLSFEIDHTHTMRLSKPARGAYSSTFGEHWLKKDPGPEVGAEILRCLSSLGATVIGEHQAAGYDKDFLKAAFDGFRQDFGDLWCKEQRAKIPKSSAAELFEAMRDEAKRLGDLDAKEWGVYVQQLGPEMAKSLFATVAEDPAHEITDLTAVQLDRLYKLAEARLAKMDVA